MNYLMIGPINMSFQLDKSLLWESMSLKLHSSSCGSSGKEHLSPNRTIKTQTTTFVLACVMVWLALTTELHPQVHIKMTIEVDISEPANLNMNPKIRIYWTYGTLNRIVIFFYSS